MPVPKPRSSNSMEMVKSVEGNDSLDAVVKQAVGKEPFVSYSRPADSPVQLIQLLHAFEQQELPGWPLLTPLRIQMQKCDKCSREFCSPLNYRRHIRVHHRLKQLDKDSAKNRDLLAAFWDKISMEEEMEVVSFKNVALEELPGSSIVMALMALIQKPALSALPQVYLRAGSVLLDIIQGKPSRFPISSRELFCILDDASENTFLRGNAASMQKYVFDGEAGKIGLETKNLVACTSFLLEQKLVKAWLADKDAEALRCQKLLVEEEEAAQRRQAKLLERKRQKKLRQKEQRGKEQDSYEMPDLEETVIGMTETQEAIESSLGTPDSSDSDAQKRDVGPRENSSSSEVLKLHIPAESNYDIETGRGNYTGNELGEGYEGRSGRRHVAIARWPGPLKPQLLVPNGFHPNQHSHASKLGAMQKYGIVRDSRAPPPANSSKVWSRKTRAENDGGSLKFSKSGETINESDESRNNQVIIGSISVTLRSCSPREDNAIAKDQKDSTMVHEAHLKNNMQEKPSKLDQIPGGTNRSIIKLWRPVSRSGNKTPKPLKNNSRDSEMEVISRKREDASENPVSGEVKSDLALTENIQTASLQFNCQEAKALLAQRWKEATAAEHVTLVLSPKPENDHQAAVARSLDSHKCNILGNAENRLVSVSVPQPGAKPKHRMKPEKGLKIKYVPKHSTVT